MDVSVIIVNYNTRQLLCDCLVSIHDKTTGIDYEVIVVDNDSKDDSREVVTSRFPWVKWIQSDENLGFGRANNLGMKHAQGKYFFFLNSDTLLVNNALLEFYRYSEANPGFGALGCILYGKDMKPCHSYGRFPTQGQVLKETLAKYLRFLKDKSKFNPKKSNSPIRVDYITGADLWVPRSVFEKVGGFDPKYFMYFEESDWQCRMKKSGFDRIIIPGPEIIHLEGGSDKSESRTWSPTRLANFYKSQKIYQKKFYSKWSYPFFRIIYLLLNSPSIIMTAIYKNGGVRTTDQNAVNHRASRRGVFSKIKTALLLFIADRVPMSMYSRAQIYRRCGARIGKDCLIGPLTLDAIHPEDVIIGDGCTVTKGVVLLTHFYDTSILNEHAYTRGILRIGNRCYIGMNAIFTKPVNVGDGAVIGAGSVVTKDIPPYEVWAGVPARFICKRYKEDIEIPDVEAFKPR